LVINFLYIEKNNYLDMAKGKLNNLLSFKDFSGGLPTNSQKKTKRTDVGLDILNENFYDKLVYKVKNDRPLEATLAEFKTILLKSIKAGTVDKYEEKKDGHYFSLRDRDFVIFDDGKSGIKTPRNVRVEKVKDAEGKVVDKNYHHDWVNFELPSETASEIISALEKLDYL